MCVGKANIQGSKVEHDFLLSKPPEITSKRNFATWNFFSFSKIELLPFNY